MFYVGMSRGAVLDVLEISLTVNQSCVELIRTRNGVCYALEDVLTRC